MRKRSRPLPEAFEEATDAELDECTDEQLAARFAGANSYEKERIFGVFRKRTGQELKE